MACRLFGAKPLSKQMLGYCPSGTNFTEILIKKNKNKIQNFHENASENIVCEMAAIFFQGEMS